MMIELAHVCGSLGQALAVVDGRTWLYDSNGKRSPTSNDIRFFFDYGLEVQTAQPPIDEEKLLQLIGQQASRFDVIQNVLIGMDGQLDSELRLRRMRAVNRKLSDSAVMEYAETRLLRPAPSQEWDSIGATKLAAINKLQLVGQIYEIIAGPTLIQIEDVIIEWARKEYGNPIDQRIALTQSYESGLVARVATELFTGRAEGLKSHLVFDQSHKWNQKLAARLVNAFADRPASRMREIKQDEEYETDESQVDIVRARFDKAIEVFESDKRKGKSRRTGSRSEMLEPVLKQIEWIERNISSNRVEAAWNAVGDLIEKQLLEMRPRDLAKSLTHIAQLFVTSPAQAASLLDMAEMCAPDDPIIGTQHAELLRAMGKTNEALIVYNRSVEQFPQSVHAWSGRAETLRALGRLDDALTSYDKTVELFPKDVVARNGRTETLRAMGRLDEALDFYDETVELFPQDVVARNGRAEILRATGRLDEALDSYDETVELFPQDVVAQSGRAETLRVLGRLDESLASYNDISAQFPRDQIARNARAVLLSELGRWEEARAAIQMAVDNPLTFQDWVAVHIDCTIEAKSQVTQVLVDRLQHCIASCPFPQQIRYFETTLVAAQIGLRRTQEARASLNRLESRTDFDGQEKSALRFMRIHAEVVDGDVTEAQRDLEGSPSPLPNRQMQLHRMWKELGRLVNQQLNRTLEKQEEGSPYDRELTRLEIGFWTNRAYANDNQVRLIA